MRKKPVMKIMNIHCSIINLEPRQFTVKMILESSILLFEKLRIKFKNLIKIR